MGCYLSAPDNRVYVTEGKGKNFTYATASCRGWRMEQEDAEACIPYYDDDASLFVLCDGHGGAEVAQYTVEHYPDYLKNHELYKEGKYEEALRNSFIEFDALLRTDDVMQELVKLAADGSKKDNDQSKDDENDENDRNDSESGDVTNKVLDLNEDTPKKQENDSVNDDSKTKVESHEQGPSGSACSSSGGSGSSKFKNGPHSIVEDIDTETLRKEALVPLKDILGGYTSKRLVGGTYLQSPVVKARSESDDVQDKEQSTEDQQPRASSSKDSEENSGIDKDRRSESLKESLIRQVMERYFPDEDGSDDDSEYDVKVAEDDEDGDDEGEEDEGATRKRKRKKHKPRKDDEEDDDEDSDGDDEDEYDEDEEEDEDEDEDEDDDEDDESNDDEEGEEENDDEDDEEEEEDAEDLRYVDLQDGDIIGEEKWKELQLKMKGSSKMHRPGVDSGCTVVVALIKDNKIYVASAGDSRCIIIMRSGQCKAMSFDHKPEDTHEFKRIVSAGGHVLDGRVNSGLNLSRAFGDFSYKDADLPAEEQMITPCPDVRETSLNINEVEYIFLACDGIWNSMNNIMTSKFIQKAATSADNNLVEICIQLFRACIAPKADGDGTGCDNMTCILARFDKETSAEKPSQSFENQDLNVKMNDESKTSLSRKRTISEEGHSEVRTKRRCLSL